MDWNPVPTPGTCTVVKRYSGSPMWIAIEGVHAHYADVAKMHRLQVVHVGAGNYKVVGSVGDVDVCIKSGIPNAKDADEFLHDFVKQIM
jgi:hypothetical protein